MENERRDAMKLPHLPFLHDIVTLLFAIAFLWPWSGMNFHTYAWISTLSSYALLFITS